MLCTLLCGLQHWNKNCKFTDKGHGVNACIGSLNDMPYPLRVAHHLGYSAAILGELLRLYLEVYLKCKPVRQLYTRLVLGQLRRIQEAASKIDTANQYMQHQLRPKTMKTFPAEQERHASLHEKVTRQLLTEECQTWSTKTTTIAKIEDQAANSYTLVILCP